MRTHSGMWGPSCPFGQRSGARCGAKSRAMCQRSTERVAQGIRMSDPFAYSSLSALLFGGEYPRHSSAPARDRKTSPASPCWIPRLLRSHCSFPTTPCCRRRSARRSSPAPRWTATFRPNPLRSGHPSASKTRHHSREAIRSRHTPAPDPYSFSAHSWGNPMLPLEWPKATSFSVLWRNATS